MPIDKISLIIAENDPKIAALYRKFVSSDIFDLTLASDGQETLRAYDKKKPDLIVLDNDMPGLSRSDLVKQIREARGDEETTIIVAADERAKQELEKDEEADIQGVLVKPFNLKTLNGSILKHYPHYTSEIDLDYDQDADKKIKLMIAEDDKKVALLYRKFLPPTIFDVRIVADGQEAIDGYLAFEPHIIILDLLMPKISGLDLLKMIREERSDFFTTIIVATSQRKEAVVRECVKYKIQGYMIKPFDLKKLTETILEYRNRHLNEMRDKGWLDAEDIP